MLAYRRGVPDEPRATTDTTDTNHELMHPVGDAPAWSESYYFNFVDPDSKIAMFTRMGWRPGDGWADALHVVYLEGRRVLFTYGRRDIGTDLTAYDGDLRVGGLELECNEAHRSWTVAYSGDAQDIADGAILLERRKQRPDGWYQPATLDMSVTFTCTSDAHFTWSDDPDTGAKGHFEQSGRVEGRITVGDETWDVAGHGVRDKSWGPRDWGAAKRSDDSGGASDDRAFSTAEAPNPFVVWFSANFGPDIAMGGVCWPDPDGIVRGGGWIHRDGAKEKLHDVEVVTRFADGSLIHDGVTLTARTGSGDRVEIEGVVWTVCPTKIPMRNGATFVNEGVAEFTWGDRVGYGIAEVWHAVRL